MPKNVAARRSTPRHHCCSEPYEQQRRSAAGARQGAGRGVSSLRLATCTPAGAGGRCLQRRRGCLVRLAGSGGDFTARLSETAHRWRASIALKRSRTAGIRCRTSLSSATASGAMDTQIVPDAATCPACGGDARSPRTSLPLPLINCTHCGPRFTIIRAMPYDRPATSMAPFPLCMPCETGTATRLTGVFTPSRLPAGLRAAAGVASRGGCCCPRIGVKRGGGDAGRRRDCGGQRAGRFSRSVTRLTRRRFGNCGHASSARPGRWR